jgi:diacylglycerol kinase (ATP)
MYYYIVNPAAGGVQRNQDKVRQRLDELGIRGEWAKTTGPGEATKMAKAAIAKGHTTIVAVGGDDTVNEVINGITASNIAVGIIPLGSANHVAMQLGIENWHDACAVLAARRLTSYSLIGAGQKFFLSTLTMGFETELDKQLDATDASGFNARLRQFLAGWGHARNYEALSCRIRVNDTFTIEGNVFSLSIANQKVLNPLAENRLLISMSDRPAKRLQLGSFLWNLLRNNTAGAHVEEAATTRFLAERVLIETTPPTGLMIDGKVGAKTPIAIRLTDRKIRFITEKPEATLRTDKIRA